MTAMNDPEMVGRLNGLNHQLLHQNHHSTPAAVVPPTATATVAESAAAILENVTEVTIQSTQNSNEENHSTINSEDSARVSLIIKFLQRQKYEVISIEGLKFLTKFESPCGFSIQTIS